MKDLIVLILAGGNSDRFWPLGDKHALSFLGKPLAYHALSQLSKFGFKNIVIVTNKQNEFLFKKLKKEFSGLTINLVSQTDSRGMAGAVVSAKEHITGKPLLVISSSDIYEDLLISSFKKELENDPNGIIAGIKQNTYFPGGYLQISENKVQGIVEKPPPEKTPSNIVTIVFDYFKNSENLLNSISKVTGTTDDLFEKAIDKLIKDGLNFNFLLYKGFWGYLKFPWHTLNVSSYYLNRLTGQKIEKSDIHKTAVISGNVWIEEGVKILENTKIAGPAYIGKNTVVGQNCLIRESMIGANCVVGYSTEIARSYIGDSCWFHTNYIGDSVISSNVGMGAGTVLANYKLSEGSVKTVIAGKKVDTEKIKLGSMIGANVRIGINSSIMPGIKIGKNCFVGPAVLLDRDLPDNKSCRLVEAKYEIKPNKTVLTGDSRKANFSNLKLS